MFHFRLVLVSRAMKSDIHDDSGSARPCITLFTFKSRVYHSYQNESNRWMLLYGKGKAKYVAASNGTAVVLQQRQNRVKFERKAASIKFKFSQHL